MEPLQEAYRLQAKAQQQRVHFVQNEIAVAYTFLDLAKVTRQEETRERNIQNARKAYDEVAFQLAGKLDCSDEQRAELEGGLAKLRARLNEEIYA